MASDAPLMQERMGMAMANKPAQSTMHCHQFSLALRANAAMPSVINSRLHHSTTLTLLPNRKPGSA